MGLTVLPDNVLRRMKPEDRKAMGKAGVTAQEAQEKLDLRLEKGLQRSIANILRRREIAFLCPRMDKRTTIRKSWPDFTFALNGQACALEAKKPGGKASEDQLKRHAEMRRNGWMVAVVDSYSEVLHTLDEWDVTARRGEALKECAAP